MPSRNGPPGTGLGPGLKNPSFFSGPDVVTKDGFPLFPILAFLTRRLSSSLAMDSSAIVSSTYREFGLYPGVRLPKLSGIAALDA